jgi:hypothetical protein
VLLRRVVAYRPLHVRRGASWRSRGTDIILMARAYVENLLTGRWGPDQQILTWWRRELGYDVDKVMVIGGRPELRLHPWT